MDDAIDPSPKPKPSLAEVVTEPAPTTVEFGPEQMLRIRAAKIAAELLTSRLSGLGAGRTAPALGQLLDLARWLLTGAFDDIPDPPAPKPRPSLADVAHSAELRKQAGRPT